MMMMMMILYLYAIRISIHLSVFPIFSHKAEYFWATSRTDRKTPNSIWLSMTNNELDS